jgi:CHAT domain-containing protein
LTERARVKSRWANRRGLMKMGVFVQFVRLAGASIVLLAILVAAGFYGYVQVKGWQQTRTAHASSFSAENSNDPTALLNEAVRLYWLNNSSRAAPLFARAEQLFAARGDTRDEIYAQVGRVRSEVETMSFVEVSRFLSKQLDKPIVKNDLRLLLWCLAAKGYTDLEIDHEAAKRDWLEAQKIALRLGDDRWATRASGELGLIAGLEAKPGRAARLLGGALLSTMANGDIGGQIRFLELLGFGFDDVGRHAEALKFFERAIRLAEVDSDAGLPFMGYEGKARALVALDKADVAKRVLEEALIKTRSQQRQGHEAQILALLGNLAAQNGDKQRAIAYLEEAGQIACRMELYSVEADAMFELARLYRETGDLVTAEARAGHGLATSQRVSDRYYVPHNLSILADLKARRGHIAAAKILYQQAEDVIEGMLIGVDELYWNSSVSAAMSQTYLQHFELVAQSGDNADAFRVLERVRGRTLSWALEDREALASAESEQTTALENDISSLQVRLMQTDSANERDQLLDKLVENERRLGLAWTRGDSANQRLPMKPVPLARVQSDLESDEVLLEYVLDDPNSFCISISRVGEYVRVLPVARNEVEKLTQELVDEIREKRAGETVSKKLFELLVKPIPETATAARFIIAPDGILNLLPFEALRDSRGDYLLKSHVISYVPSATIFDVLRRAAQQASAPRPFLGVGDVAYENQGGVGRKMPAPSTLRGRIIRGISDMSGIRLHDLPQTREEVERIGRIVGPGAVTLLGKDATETAFKKAGLDQFRVLHLAVHGFADTQYPERSALILGRDPKSGDDGLLQVREIIRLRLDAELTTLSACDTGVGKLQGQEGISNLAEAFLVAGSRSVVASLWSADDTFASALMARFYERLAQGENTGSALRNAKLDLLAKFGDQVSPFYWAAFISVGETSTPVGIKKG